MDILVLIQKTTLLIDFTLPFLDTVFELDYFGLIPKVVVLVENERPERHLPRAHACIKRFHANLFFYANQFQIQIKRRLIFILIML